MNQHKQPGEPPDESVESIFVERPGPKPELESDVHPQRHPDEDPLPDESDNIPGDESDPNLVQGRQVAPDEDPGVGSRRRK